MNRLTVIICTVFICLLVSMAWAINHYRDNATTYKDQRDKATARANASESVTNNVITAVNIIHDISQATQNAKQELAQQGETRIVYIQKSLEGDQCAKQLVPAAATDELRRQADSLRTGSSGADKR